MFQVIPPPLTTWPLFWLPQNAYCVSLFPSHFFLFSNITEPNIQKQKTLLLENQTQFFRRNWTFVQCFSKKKKKTKLLHGHKNILMTGQIHLNLCLLTNIPTFHKCIKTHFPKPSETFFWLICLTALLLGLTAIYLCNILLITCYLGFLISNFNLESQINHCIGLVSL